MIEIFLYLRRNKQIVLLESDFMVKKKSKNNFKKLIFFNNFINIS